LSDDASGGGVDDGEVDPVAIGIDAHHVRGEFCKHEPWTSE
jgi:hypothetical protein